MLTWFQSDVFRQQLIASYRADPGLDQNFGDDFLDRNDDEVDFDCAKCISYVSCCQLTFHECRPYRPWTESLSNPLSNKTSQAASQLAELSVSDRIASMSLKTALRPVKTYGSVRWMHIST